MRSLWLLCAENKKRDGSAEAEILGQKEKAIGFA